MKETQFRKNGKNDGRAGEKDTQKKQKSKAFKREKTKGQYGRVADAVKIIDPRQE